MMDMDPNVLMLSVLLGAVGMGLFIFGKKQERPVHLVAGLMLMVLPYVVPNPLVLLSVAAVVTLCPFLLPW
jgi:hypothetical protein